MYDAQDAAPRRTHFMDFIHDRCIMYEVHDHTHREPGRVEDQKGERQGTHAARRRTEARSLMLDHAKPDLN